jgi:hypothetical protein
VPTVDLIPARKLERIRAVEQHQKELEVEFEARFPALYRKAQTMRPYLTLEESPSPPPRSPPPPFPSVSRSSQPFKDVDWAGARKEDDDDFDLRKGPLVGPLTSGLERMLEAGKLSHSASETASRGYHEDYPEKARRDVYADDYEHEYDEIDPKGEGLRNDPGFQSAGAAESRPGSGLKVHERAGGEDTLKKAAKKRPQIWERWRSGGGK